MSSKFVLQAGAIFFAISLSTPAPATEPPPPVLDTLVSTGSTKGLRFEPFPGAQAYSFFSATNAGGLFTANTNFYLMPYVTGYSTNYTTNGPVTVTNLAYEWRLTNYSAPGGFFRIAATPMASNTMAVATVLNRLAYGPTPDDLEIYSNSPQAYINQQLAMEGIVETMDNYTVETINTAAFDPTTNWTFVTIKGTLNTTNLYLYMTAPGDVFVDDLELIEGTNGVPGPNLLVNGDFESAFSPAWLATNGATGSHLTNSVAHSGSSCLHFITTTAGNTSSNFVRQQFVSALTNGTPITLSYWFLPGPTSQKLIVRNGSGNTLISSAGGIPPTPTWVYAKATGTANANSRIYIYLSGAGTAYVDDIKLVQGTNAGVGTDLLQNGGFESPLAGTWSLSADFSGSTLSTTAAHSGNSSLKLVASNAGGGNGDSVQQTVSPALVNGQTYTVSFWYLPAAPSVNVTVKLDGNFLQSTPDTDLAGLYRRMNSRAAPISDYRTWYCQHAVNSQRQLFEILSQFIENHFVTQWSKSRDFLQGKGYSNTDAGILATDWEWREMKLWREALLNPNCTFYDLLKISAESPAQIVFLDTVNSKGNNNNIANENYARELLELFTWGVDNGYDQNDIVLMSRAWTGWSVELVDEVNAASPFAPASATYYPNTNSVSKANIVGKWAFNFMAGNHGTNRGALFAGKTVPARFGPPWAGDSYQLTIPTSPPRSTGLTNGIQDGYDVIAHLANQPFAAEYLSVKLCRLFVHDDFPNPTTRPELPEYAFYNYTDPNRSAEAELVRQCMLAYENSSPKGNIRAVLSTIFNSDLFRSHTATSHKVKTPLEFVVSSVRALRSVNADGSATATTDGNAFAVPLNRMGQMDLFDRAAPDGYPEDAAPWISAGTLVERIRFVQSFCIAGGQTGHNGTQGGTATGNDAGNNFCNPVALITKKIPGSLLNASAVADYFLGILYPGEGAANLALYRTAAINFLNTADNGTSSPFANLTVSSTAGDTYDTRVRGMVAMLMTSPRFQEQ